MAQNFAVNKNNLSEKPEIFGFSDFLLSKIKMFSTKLSTNTQYIVENLQMKTTF